jgi:2-dehydro-3-deoxyphosphooctonate aldolase (KDO 8-P synthase)
MHNVPVADFFVGENEPLTLVSGPCVIESEEHCLKCAEELKKIIGRFPVNFIFKASYDKANRSAHSSFRGVGIDKGLQILVRVRKEFGLPIVTDVHSPEEATTAGAICDVIQIPAFLCRQTDLLLAAGQTQAAVQVKKGQFLAPWDVGNIIEKLKSVGNEKIILVERGVSFGYNTLVSDMRSIPIMQGFGYPVCFDATHSVQQPGGLGKTTGGQREYIPTLAKAAVASGANAIFMEAHPDPKNSKSDAASILDFKDLPALLDTLVRLYEIVNPKAKKK